MNRYEKQIIIDKIGTDGQLAFKNAKIIILGMGATGSNIANLLVRAGFGKITFIDRDIVELSNLQRQTLYDETDVNNLVPKAIAAYNKLTLINSEVILEAKVLDIDSDNIEELIKSYDLVIDGTDNFLTRFLINDACVKLNIPWLFSGVLGVKGQSALIIPSITHCLSCFLNYDFTCETCNTEGVLSSTINFLAAIAFTKIQKYFLKIKDENLTFFDTWTFEIKNVLINKNSSCSTCIDNNFLYLNKEINLEAVTCKNKNLITIKPTFNKNIDLNTVLKNIPEKFLPKHNSFVLQFLDADKVVTIFNNGRATFHNYEILDAKKLYNDILGN